MIGPYKVEYLADSIVIRGPYTKTSPTVMSTPHIVCDHMNAAHRAAIERAIGVVEDDKLWQMAKDRPADLETPMDALVLLSKRLRTLLTDKESHNAK